MAKIWLRGLLHFANEGLKELRQIVLPGKSGDPFGRNCVRAVKNTGESTGDAAGCIGVIAEIYSFQNAFGEGVCSQEAPDRGD